MTGPRNVAPTAAGLLPVSLTTLLSIVGVVECAVGVTILVLRPSLGAYVASAWLLLVAANLVLGGHLDIAVRDVVLSVAAFTLARLEEIRAEDAAHLAARVSHGRTVTA